MVLDEVTASLDNETESGYKTLIIIVHRLSTIGKCNRIYEIKDGKAFLIDKREIFR